MRPGPFAALAAGDSGVVAGRYELRQYIGSGGSAAVYLGRDRRLDRDVAVKLLRPECAADPSFVERFRREARAAAALNDPHVVAIYDFGFAAEGAEENHASASADGSAVPFIVMEYVPGASLKDVLRRRGPLPEREALDVAAQIAAALEAAHQRGVIHRDVKPHNILLDDRGWVKVADFGLARATSAAQLTHTSIVLGTPYYLSPEQAQGRAVDPRTDLYAMGIVLYKLLTGRVPFMAESQVGVAMKHVRDPMPDVQKMRPEVSAALAAVVERATAKELKNRYGSVDEMLDALEQALDWQEREEPSSRSSVLNACRSWQWLETGEWISKPAAAAWLRGRVREALESAR